MKKLENFSNCLNVLKNADFDLADNNDIYRTGVIGQFNLTIELAWKALQEKLSSLPFTDKKVRSFNRFFLGGAEALDADKQGRVLVPSTLRDYASLTSQVVWVGVGDHIEIWDIDKWNEQMDEYLLSEDAEEKIEDLADYMAGLGV